MTQRVLPQPKLLSETKATFPEQKFDVTTELGRYKAKVYRLVGAYWFSKIGRMGDILPVGHVRVQYTIYADGTVATKVLDAGDKYLQVLLSISVNAIREASPFPPFSPALRKEVGDRFTDDFTFSVYGDFPESTDSPKPHDSGESKPYQATPVQTPASSLPGVD